MRLFVALLAAAWLAFAAACGGDGQSGGGGGERASASEWSGDVCTALGDWGRDLETSSQELPGKMTGVTELEEARTILVGFLDRAVERTDTMIAGVEAAGTPDVADGEEIAQAFQDNVADFRTQLSDAGERAEALPTDDPAAFAQGAQELGSDIEQAGSNVESSFRDLEGDFDTDEIDQAFDDEPACRELDSASG